MWGRFQVLERERERERERDFFFKKMSFVYNLKWKFKNVYTCNIV